MKMPIIITPNMLRWEPYFGNNHSVVESEVIKYGDVSFTKHIGKPLSDLLWDDLVCRMRVKRIRIYAHDNREEWTDGPPRAHIYLDKNMNIEEITVSFC